MAIITRRYTHVGPSNADLTKFVHGTATVTGGDPWTTVVVDIDDAAGNIDTLDAYMATLNFVPSTTTPPAGLAVEDEGAPLPGTFTSLDFVGGGVVAADAGGGVAQIAIPGGISGIEIDDEGAPLPGSFTGIDFVGGGVVAADAGGGVAQVFVPGITFADEAIPVGGAPHDVVNFIGAGVTAANAGAGQVNVTIPGGIAGIGVEDDGAPLPGAFTSVDFAGAGVTATDAGGGVALVTIPGGGIAGIEVQDEGGALPGTFTALNFTGAGVTATDAGGGVANVDIPGGASSSSAVLPNILRNSGFWFSQCYDPTVLSPFGTSIAGAANSRIVGPDGWMACWETAGLQHLRVDTSGAVEAGLSGRFYTRIVKPTNAGKMMFMQALESADVQSLRGNVVRVQMLLKANVVGATYRMGLLQLTAAGTVDVVPAWQGSGGAWTSAWNGASVDPTLTAANNIAYVAPLGTDLDNTTVVGNALNCVVTGAWQRFGGTFTVPSDCNNLLVALWSDSQIPVDDGISVAQASMTLGTPIATWTQLTTDLELLRCQRYIVKTFATNTRPVQNGGTVGMLQGITGRAGAVAGAWTWEWRFPVPLLVPQISAVNDAVPPGFPSRSLTRYNPLAANTSARNLTAAVDMAPSANITVNPTNLLATFTGIGGGGGTDVGDHCGIHLLIQAEL